MIYPLYLANEPHTTDANLVVTNKFDGNEWAKVSIADESLLEKAVVAGRKAIPLLKKLSTYERQQFLFKILAEIEKEQESLATALVYEAGKPITDAKGEVGRLIDTFRIAACETISSNGEVIPVDGSPRGKSYQGMWKRFPVGLCSFIAPFNFPLNLAAHKIAPALAVGCPFILKPASRTPVTALLLGNILARVGLPPGTFSILPCDRKVADKLITDHRLDLISFTGSGPVGWDIKARAGRKKVILELGGNASVIVEPDCDLDWAVKRIGWGAFYQAGQSCISVQNILVQEKIYDSVKMGLISSMKAWKAGSPLDPSTSIAPLIDESEAVRLEKWIAEAVAQGAVIVAGGKRKGPFLEPTLLEKVPESLPLCADEAFGPVAILSPYQTLDEAIERTNRSRFGLQAGLFTQNLQKGFRAWEELEVGGVILNDIPSFRADNMPYGGIKESGMGREGIALAMQELSEVKMLVIKI